MESLNKEVDQYLEAINKHGFFVGTTKGFSMRPLLREGIDSIVLSKITRKLKKYDVVLYKRKSGSYVLHRIIKIKNGEYIFCGDNQWVREKGITDADIIAILTGFYRKERYVSVNNFFYKIYYHLRVFFRPLRKLRDRILKVLIPIKHKIFKDK